MNKLTISVAMLILAIAASITAARAQSAPITLPLDVLFNFGANSDDPIDVTGMIQGSDGNIYGTSAGGGLFGYGTIWKYDVKTEEITILHSFDVFDGATPIGGLTLCSDGFIRGTTSEGGVDNDGTIFEVRENGLGFETRYDFSNDAFGGDPDDTLVEWSPGVFYLTTATGGDTEGSCGTVDKLDLTSGTPTLTTVFIFTQADGCHSWAPLVVGNGGTLYGTSYTGGANGDGSLWKINPRMATGNFQKLHDFDGTDGSGVYGLTPVSGSNFRGFYGGTTTGGTKDGGVAFSITGRGDFSELASFPPNQSPTPYGTLLAPPNGLLFGLTSNSIFDLSTLKPHKLTLDYRFQRATTGYMPAAPLLLHSSGTVYGATTLGALHGHGALFSLDLGLNPGVTVVPSYVTPGQTLDILGEDFKAGQITVVFPGGLTALPLTNNLSHTFLKVTVPAGATTGPVTVVTGSITLPSFNYIVVW